MRKKLKKVLVTLFIITLLSNYILTLNEVGNVVFASSIELTPEFTSDINSINESNNEIKSLDLLRLRQYLLGEYVFK